MHDTFRKGGGGVHHSTHHAAAMPVHHFEGKMPPPPEGAEPMSPLLMATVTMTFLVFAVIFLCNDYTLGHLIPTLAMVETPSAVLVESTVVTDNVDLEDNGNPKNAMLPTAHREAAIIEQAPITSSLLQTSRHLRAVGGFLGRFRGFSLYAIYSILLVHFFDALAFILPRPIAYPITALLFAIPRMTWTHIIISSPTSRPWFRRFPALKDAMGHMRKISGPTTLVALTEIIASMIFLEFCPAELRNPELIDRDEMDCTKMQALVYGTILAGLASVAWTCLVVVPSTAVLAKIQTSLLHEDEDTILVVDRTENMGFAAAWASFDWNARARVYKAYARFWAVQIACVVLMLGVVYAEFVAFLGWGFEEKLPQTLYATAWTHSAWNN